jgi:hypothetical protein
LLKKFTVKIIQNLVSVILSHNGCVKVVPTRK